MKNPSSPLFRTVVCQLVINCMIWSPAKKLFIFLLIATLPSIMGCRTRYEVKSLNLKAGTEDVFCHKISNRTRAESLPEARFYAAVWHDEDLKKNFARLEARENDGSPILMVGRELKEGDTFGFKNVKWEILKIGMKGLTIDGDEVCGGHQFMHVNRLEPKPNN
jgi:hypothetical protein